MKKIDLGQTIGILANLGVIAGIVFLALEIRQNNTLMTSQSRANQSDQVLSFQADVYSDAGLSEILIKADAGESLSDAEQLRLDAFQQRVLLGMQFQFEEFQNGALDRVNLAAWRAIYRGDNTTMRVPLDRAWRDLKDSLRPEFADYFQRNVVEQ
jgi:hypothetical protein